MGIENEASSSAPLLPLHPCAKSDHLSSQPKTFANVFIAIVGAGVLGLPYTFMRTGWAAGVITLLAVSALTFHCMMLLVKTRRRLDAKISSFGDLGAAVCGPGGRLSVDLMIVLSQAGFCVGYLIFISNSLTHLYPLKTPISTVFFAPKAIYIWVMLPFQLGLNSIKTLTLLAPLSIFADVVDLGAMGVVLGQDVSIFLSNQLPVRAFGGPSMILYGIGVAVYAFEGIGMVLPLEAEAKDKSKFGKTLGLSMFLIAIMYGSFGVLGYLAFGDDTRDIITTNFGGGWLTLVVQLGLCVNLFFTMPIMMNPVYEVAERWFCGKNYCWYLRWVLVLLVCMGAMLVPNFADFLSLIGSSVCVVLGFVLPAAFHLKVFGGEMGWGGIAADIVLVLTGTVLAASGTWSSLMTIFYSAQDESKLLVYGAGALVSLWISSVVSAVNSIPLFTELMEVVDLGYTVCFSSLYLLFKMKVEQAGELQPNLGFDEGHTDEIRQLRESDTSTTLCKFFVNGMCNKGMWCQCSHSLWKDPCANFSLHLRDELLLWPTY